VHNPLLRTHYLTNKAKAIKAKRTEFDGEGGGQVSDIGDTIGAAFDQMYCGLRAPFNPQSQLVTVWRSAETLAGYAQ